VSSRVVVAVLAGALFTPAGALGAAATPAPSVRVTPSPVGLDQDVVVRLAGLRPGVLHRAQVVVVSTYMRGYCVERQAAEARSDGAGRLRLRFARSDRFGLWCGGSRYRGTVRRVGRDRSVAARFGFQVIRAG
jgi:hypothetical protein